MQFLYKLPDQYINTHLIENKDTFPSITIGTRRFSLEYFGCKFENAWMLRSFLEGLYFILLQHD